MTDDQYPLAGTKVEVPPTHIEHQPPYVTRYPLVINSELINPGPRAAMEGSWQRGAFPAQDLEIFHLKDVYVINAGMIFDQNLRLITNASDFEEYEIDRAVRRIRHRLANDKMARYPSLGVLAKRPGGYNYGHFLLEMLPMAYIGRMLYGQHDPTYLIHQAPMPILDAMLRAFRLLGFPLGKLLATDLWEPIFFTDLVTVRGLTKHGSYMSPWSVQLLELMAAKVPAGPRERLFVRRVPNWPGHRKLLNEADICSRLEAKGFHCVEPGGMTLEQQIALFRSAELVVGVAGAGMTNIAFSPRKIPVVSLVPGTFADTFFWFIANLKEMNYIEIRGDQPTRAEPEALSADFTIREEDIRLLEVL